MLKFLESISKDEKYPIIETASSSSIRNAQLENQNFDHGDEHSLSSSSSSIKSSSSNIIDSSSLNNDNDSIAKKSINLSYDMDDNAHEIESEDIMRNKEIGRLNKFNMNDKKSPSFSIHELTLKWLSYIHSSNSNKLQLDDLNNELHMSSATSMQSTDTLSESQSVLLNKLTSSTSHQTTPTRATVFKNSKNNNIGGKIADNKPSAVLILNKQYLYNNLNEKSRPYLNRKENNLVENINLSKNDKYKQKQLLHNISYPFNPSTSPPPAQFIYVSSTTTSFSQTSTSLHHHLSELNYRNNEIYSIFVSMFTAAIFLFFIMWRWFRLKSDLRKALREQIQIQQQQQQDSSSNNGTNGGGSRTSQSSGRTRSSNLPAALHRWPAHQCQAYLMLNSQTREELQSTAASIINQLANSNEHRTPAQQKQMIDTAKYCLQQLRLHARLTRQHMYNNHSLSSNREHDYLSNYYTFNSRYDRGFRHQNSVELSCSRNSSRHNNTTDTRNSNNSMLPDSSSSPYLSIDNQRSSTPTRQILTNTNNYYGSICSSSNGSSGSYQQRTTINELPPPYESILVKSSSLPSYRHLSSKNDDKLCD